MPPTFDDFVSRATGGQHPYAYQRCLAVDGLPELLRVPTGAGKTLAATLPWLYRRRAHPDPAVRDETPHWLVLVLPMRVLVEQTADSVGEWLHALGLSEGDVGRYVVMGGEPRTSGWRLRPEQDAIFVGTLDMLLSRALNRGYGEGRGRWPLDFGLFNAGVQWVFDEVQLMGPALPTSRQLEGLREKLGTAAPCRSMWMSATVDKAALRTVDRPTIGSVVELAADDAQGALRSRLEATKTVRRLHLDDAHHARSLASLLVDRHRQGTRTIAVLNTVDRARDLYQELRKLDRAEEVVLLHSRFRPPERRAQVEAALADVDTAGPGLIVVSTQVLEAGVDLTSTTLFTEAAVWPSVVQRAGRCNRGGEATDALLLWAPPPKAPPYDEGDVAAAVTQLEELEGQALTPPAMSALAVEARKVVHPVLRRRDLLGLFDTTPDLGGNDLDVGRFLREANDLDVALAWRPVGKEGPGPDDDAPGRDERCPVPVGQARTALRRLAAWRFDHLSGGWQRAADRDVRPGHVLVLRSDEGGYRADVGWDPTSGLPVPPPATVDAAPGDEAEYVGGDPMSYLTRHWVGLFDHLQHAHDEVRQLTGVLRLPGLSYELLEAAATAAVLHDIGKAHPVFQCTLQRSADDPAQQQQAATCGPPWAKSAGHRYPHRRPHFRHELAGALALLGEASVALDGVAEADLVTYLVGAHHGKVRVGFRTLPEDDKTKCPGGGPVALGVCHGEPLPAVDTPRGRLPESRLDLSVMELGDSADGQRSWTARALELRDRLGPFRLAFLEALVICADWRASAGEDQGPA
ncbi:MAG: type I-G CRISPR-associated helicase/endonuclease Cas3g [Acidimicrobiales bacterium]